MEPKTVSNQSQRIRLYQWLLKKDANAGKQKTLWKQGAIRHYSSVQIKGRTTLKNLCGKITSIRGSDRLT